MSKYESFDDFDGTETSQADYKPFQFRPQKDQESTLEWLNANFDQCYMAARDRLMSYRRFAARYKNAPRVNRSFMRETHRDLGNSSGKAKVQTNFFYQYIDQKVAALAKMKLNLKFIPHNTTDQSDINDADACNMLVNFRMKQLDFPHLMSEQDRRTFKYGTSFAKIYWDRKAGPVDPKYVEMIKTMKKVPELGEDGQPTGKMLSPFDVKVGDVGLKIIDSDAVFPERKKKDWKEIDFVDEVEFVNIEELKAEYPRRDIRKENYTWLDVDDRGYNFDDIVMVHHFYHRPTKWLPNGIYIKYIESTILEYVDSKEDVYKMMPDHELPFVPDFDIEADDEFWARPFLVNIEQLNNMFDLIQSGIARNIGVASHPKLLIAEGTVNLKQANNEYGVMQFRGPQKPEWLQHNYVNRGEFEIQDRLIKMMDSQAKIFEISKGQAPNGITATSALRLLEDQESTANQNTVEKKRKRVKAIYWKVMLMMNANYKDNDGRMVTVLGEDNEYLVEDFNKKPNFEKLASVDMEYVSALADSRSGRVADIIDLNAANQKEPTFGRKEIIKLLDLGLEDAFKEEMSYGSVTAKTVLERLKKGQPAPQPEPTDDLIEMYGIFSRYVESISYKMKIDPARKMKIKEYVKGLEYLMTEQAKSNLLFAAKVRTFDKFPMFYEAGSDITAAPMMPPEGAGGAGPTGDMANIQERLTKTMEDETNGGIR